MAVSYLPEQITKDILFEKAQERFQSWAKMYGNPNVSAQYMYEDMSCSCYCGSPSDDFPEIVGTDKDDVIRYQYKDGGCFFIVDGIEIMIADLRDMRGEHKFFDICVPIIDYKDGEVWIQHVIPNAWLYGSGNDDEFGSGKPVHEEFLDAARGYIKEHGITKEMQEVPDD